MSGDVDALLGADLDPHVDLERALAEYAEKGYARLGRVLDEPALEALRARADDLMLGRVTYPGLFHQHDSATGLYEDLVRREGFSGPSLRYRKLEKLELDPLFFALVRSRAFERVARALVPGPVALYRAVLFNKAAEGGTFLPFHQDGGRMWGLDRDPTLQLWTALDDAGPLAGCLEIVPGSHVGGLATPLGGVVPEARVAAEDADRHAEKVFAEAGEVILLHNHVWHRSGVNRTSRPRRAVTVCLMSAETRCLRTRRAPRRFVRVFEGV
jgi:ectoine hydroxylase-related dioxygenase (phytanoyl-CoA dioxygenase family)